MITILTLSPQQTIMVVLICGCFIFDVALYLLLGRLDREYQTDSDIRV